MESRLHRAPGLDTNSSQLTAGVCRDCQEIESPDSTWEALKETPAPSPPHARLVPTTTSYLKAVNSVVDGRLQPALFGVDHEADFGGHGGCCQGADPALHGVLKSNSVLAQGCCRQGPSVATVAAVIAR